MTLKHRFMAVSEYGRNAKESLFACLSSGIVALSLALFSFVIGAPATLLAEEAQSIETKTPAPRANTTEGILASTEQMIEQLILQIDRQRNNATESRVQSEEPTSTSYFSSIPNIRPVSGAITSAFGKRVHPIYKVTLFHSGIDFSAAEGTRVQSTGDGVIAYSGYDRGYGQKITINHGFGYQTIYAHLSKSLVRQGQRVKRGEIIALSGNTGLSTGPHLHYEVQKDHVKVNPTAYFFDESNPDKFITTQKPAPEQSDNNS